MKKNVLLLFLLLSLQAYSQVKLVEGEVMAGRTIPVSNKYDAGAILGIELRFNLVEGRYSTGFQMAKGYLDRTYNDVNDSERFFTFQTIFDYNYNPTGNFVPFAGLGLGLAKKDWSYWTEDDSSLLLTYRIGCEFYKWVRVTCEYKALKYDYSHFSIRLGIVIGGWNKK